jgi:hypothetical protein
LKHNDDDSSEDARSDKSSDDESESGKEYHSNKKHKSSKHGSLGSTSVPRNLSLTKDDSRRSLGSEEVGRGMISISRKELKDIFERISSLEDTVEKLENNVARLSEKKDRKASDDKSVKLTHSQVACISGLVRNEMIKSIKFLTPAVVAATGEKIVARCYEAANMNPEEYEHNYQMASAVISKVKRVLNVTKAHIKRNIREGIMLGELLVLIYLIIYIVHLISYNFIFQS